MTGYKYHVIFVDAISKFTLLFPFHYKSEVFTKFLEFKVFVENQFSTNLEILRSDNRGEHGTQPANRPKTSRSNPKTAST